MDIAEQKKQLEIFMRSYEIYTDRDRVRGDLWRTRPISHKFEMIREKIDRSEHALFMINQHSEDNDDYVKEFIDGLQDAINFAAFALRQFSEGERG